MAKNRIDLISSLFHKINVHLDCDTLYYNYNEIDDGVFGNFCNKSTGTATLPCFVNHFDARINSQLVSSAIFKRGRPPGSRTCNDGI